MDSMQCQIYNLFAVCHINEYTFGGLKFCLYQQTYDYRVVYFGYHIFFLVKSDKPNIIDWQNIIILMNM